MKIQPNSLYKERKKDSQYIFYMRTDDHYVYDIMCYKTIDQILTKYITPVVFVTIKDYNMSITKNSILEKLSAKEIESDLLLEML